MLTFAMTELFSQMRIDFEEERLCNQETMVQPNDPLAAAVAAAAELAKNGGTALFGSGNAVSKVAPEPSAPLFPVTVPQSPASDEDEEEIESMLAELVFEKKLSWKLFSRR